MLHASLQMLQPVSKGYQKLQACTDSAFSAWIQSTVYSLAHHSYLTFVTWHVKYQYLRHVRNY